MAEGVGIEPTEVFLPLRLSKSVHYHSANLPVAEEVGFEPTELLHSAVFKTAALNQTLPFFRWC